MSTATTTCNYESPIAIWHETGVGVKVFSGFNYDEYDGSQPVDTGKTMGVGFASSSCVEISDASGGGGASYIIDVGSTVLLGGILMFFVAYWIVGLTRHKKTWSI